MKIIYILLLLICSTVIDAWASEDYLICTYKNGTKQIKLINTNKIQRIEKMLPNGVKQLIVINDPWTLTEFENYTLLTKGEHNITYSLNCQKSK